MFVYKGVWETRGYRIVEWNELSVGKVETPRWRRGEEEDMGSLHSSLLRWSAAFGAGMNLSDILRRDHICALHISVAEILGCLQTDTTNRRPRHTTGTGVRRWEGESEFSACLH